MTHRNEHADELDPQVEEDAEREETDSITESEELSDSPLGDHRSFFDTEIPVGDEPLR